MDNKVEHRFNDRGNIWVSALDLFNRNIEEVPKLWEPFLNTTGMSILAGGSDCGKSTLLRQLATAVAQGREEFLGHLLIPKHKVVYYVVTEDDEDDLAAKLNKELRSLDGLDGCGRLQFLLDSGDVAHELEKRLQKQKADLIVFDTWQDRFSGSQNAVNDVRKYLDEFRHLTIKYHCHIILLSHCVKNSESSKPDKNKLSGSAALENLARCVLELRKGSNEGERLLTILKGNSIGESFKRSSLILHFNDENLMFSNTGKSVDRDGVIKDAPQMYDEELWLNRIWEVRNVSGMSWEACRTHLRMKFPHDKVPSKGWFMARLKASNGQSNLKKDDDLTDESNLGIAA